MAVNGETETCRYKLENNGEIEIDLRGDEDLEGRLVDNRLTLEDVMDSGVDLVFYKEGTVTPAVEVPAVTEAPAIDTPSLPQRRSIRTMPGGMATGTAGGSSMKAAENMLIWSLIATMPAPRSPYMVTRASWISGTRTARKA